MAHAFILSTREAETGESLNLRPAWSIEQVPGQSESHRKQKTKQKNLNKININYNGRKHLDYTSKNISMKTTDNIIKNMLF